MLLIIDTHDADRLFVALAHDDGTLLRSSSRAATHQQSRTLLPMIDRVLRHEKRTAAALTGVGVVSGPGGFTSVRIGVTTANALAYALGVPVVGVTTDDFSDVQSLAHQVAHRHRRLKSRRLHPVTPIYNGPPNITKPKRQMR